MEVTVAVSIEADLTCTPHEEGVISLVIAGLDGARIVMPMTCSDAAEMAEDLHLAMIAIGDHCRRMAEAARSEMASQGLVPGEAEERA